MLILFILGSCLGACQDAASSSSQKSFSWTTSIELEQPGTAGRANGRLMRRSVQK